MGGMHGFGAVPFIDDADLFHAEWERRIFAVNVAAGGLGLWNIDKVRSVMESLPPEIYLRDDSYFGRFVARLEKLVVDYELATPQELAAGEALSPARGDLQALTPEKLKAMVAKGSSSKREKQDPPLFKVGDRVRARMISPRSHTRLPRYARAHAGTIVRNYGVHVYPDHSSLGNEDPQWLYAVRFDGREIWGQGCEPNTEVVLDAFEPYLDLVETAAVAEGA